MARFTVCMVTLVVLLAAAAVSAYHSATTTSTVEIVADRGESQRCREQIERQRLSSCRQYLRDSSRFELSMLENEGGGWREAFPRCCDELERINEQCRCEAVKQVAQQQRQAGGLQGREMREMLKTAQSLPSLCRISPQSCQIIGRGPVF